MSVLDSGKYLRASNGPGAAGADAPQQAPAEAPVVKTRRRLFTKYVVLFVAVVCIALVSNGVFDVLFYYQEHKASLIRIQRTELAQLDATGKERLRVSRLAMDVVASGADLSNDPKFTEAVARKVYYGPVY